jgi:hypothetical protein
MLRRILPGILLFFGAVTANAQGGTSFTDCSITCNSTSLCTRSCTDGGINSTCGNYGVCNPDPDGDGLPYYMDNCPNNYNPDQADCDGDGRGNVCDSENAIYDLAEIRYCWIRNRLHAWGSDSTRYTERRMHDISSCGAPDQWFEQGEELKNCVGLYDSSSCCLGSWGSTMCSLYASDTCHF